ncbi:hypothetical protein HOLleu_03702 [Holothuria leucospilota]|uniref:Uncharacterized protein n=1 Tax=Holothuria leucospilota TaxID=206669 RepID=A0A9Q1CTC4_HOLLE|nr:hypothetical protein HOLleu_03702 [Holothuria leucospilota]
MARTVHGDETIANELSFVPKDLATTSHVTSKDIFHYSYLLVLLVCKAFSTPTLLESTESLVLVQNGEVNLSKKKAVSTYVERNTQMVLNCSEKDMGFAVWKRVALPSGKKYELLLYSVLIERKFTEILLENASLGNKGSLIVPHADLNHEGLYYCLHGDGISDDVSVYNVTVFGHRRKSGLQKEVSKEEEEMPMVFPKAPTKDDAKNTKERDIEGEILRNTTLSFSTSLYNNMRLAAAVKVSICAY